MKNFLQFYTVWGSKGYLLGGIFITLEVMALSYVIAFMIGLLVSSLRISKRRFLNIPTGIYVEVCRNTPTLVQLIWIFYCLPYIIGIELDPIPSSIIALAVTVGAYMSEDFRAGILAVDKGQIEAARSLGMSYREAMQKIVIPQALRILIPPLMNHAVSLMKWSSLVSVLGVADLTYRAQVLSSQTFRPVEIFTSIGAVYFIMSMTISYTVRYLERQWAMKY